MSSHNDVTEARWARMESLFDAAVDLSPSERTDFLEKSCSDDQDLLREVEALITASETGGARVAQLIGDAAGKALANTATSSHRIGPYTILSTIGQGGMGAVYLAERSDEEFEQRVAVKLLHKTMVTPELLQRFRSERQILADLNHPNIAHLVDGGTTEDGVPYIVMEYVEGKPINQYCDDNQLTITERLDLFRQVCSAIEMAHQNLIVHRDIKPNNILVARDGTPKLLDFGIAKSLVSTGDEAQDNLTRHGDRLLTPNHASPEQILGRTVTTSSDIYSLGVLLYEMLCGVCPFNLSALTPAQMERVVTGLEPMAPSRLLLAVDQGERVQGRAVSRDPQAVAMDRGTTIDKLRRELDGDLDTIVLCALHKDRNRRYRSVSLLSEDLRRHLRGLPVTARPDSWRYRASKFTQRNLLAVVVSAMFASVVVGFAVFATVQAARLADRNVSLTESNEKLTTVTELVKGILLASDPLASNNSEPVTLLEVLDRGAQMVSQELGDHPLEQADLQETIGSVYYGQGKSDEAAQNLISALSKREALLGTDDPRLVQNLLLLGNLELDHGDWERAGDLLRRALQISEQQVGDPSVELAKSQRRYAKFLRKTAAWPEAETYYRASLETYAKLGADHDAGRADVLSGLGLQLLRRGEFQQSIDLFQEALVIDLRIRGEMHPFVAHHYGNIALSSQAMGDLDAAGPLYEKALAILTKAYEPYSTSHSEVATATSNLARYYLALEQYQKAEVYYVRAVEMQVTANGEIHDSVAFLKDGLAQALKGQGRYQEAEALLNDAVSIYSETVGDPHDLLSGALRNLGNVLASQGRYSEAQRVMERALSMLQSVAAEGNWLIGDYMSDLGAVLTTTGQYDRARVLLEGAVEILTGTLGETHRLTIKAKASLQQVPVGAASAAP